MFVPGGKASQVDDTTESALMKLASTAEESDLVAGIARTLGHTLLGDFVVLASQDSGL